MTCLFNTGKHTNVLLLQAAEYDREQPGNTWLLDGYWGEAVFRLALGDIKLCLHRTSIPCKSPRFLINISCVKQQSGPGTVLLYSDAAHVFPLQDICDGSRCVNATIVTNTMLAINWLMHNIQVLTINWAINGSLSQLDQIHQTFDDQEVLYEYVLVSSVRSESRCHPIYTINTCFVSHVDSENRNTLGYIYWEK